MLISDLDFFLSYIITLLALLSFWKQELKYVLHCTGRGRRDGEGRKYIHTYIQTNTHTHTRRLSFCINAYAWILSQSLLKPRTWMMLS